MECQICFEKIKCVECEFCKYNACETCITRMGELKCANCSKTWSRSFVVWKMSTKTQNVLLKSKQMDILFDQMVAKIPTSQAMIQSEITRDTRARERKLILEELKEAKEYYIRVKQKLNRHDRMAWSSGESTHAEKPYGFHCPMVDCHGMTDDGVCVLCKTKSCVNCHTVKKENHACDEDVVKNIKAIRSETKPCPRCQTAIYKVSGCDQMYCTKPKCETFFSWSRGTITQGIAHNPEYTRFLQSGGRPTREAGDEVCGGMPTQYRINTTFQKFKLAFDILRYSRLCNHVIDVDLIRVSENRTMTDRPYLISYARNQTSKEKTKSLLLKAKKNADLNTELFNVFSLFRDVTTESFISFTQRQTVDDILAIHQIVVYAIEEIKNIQKVYSSKSTVLLKTLEQMKAMNFPGMLN